MSELIMNITMVNLLKKFNINNFTEENIKLKIRNIFNKYFSNIIKVDNCILLHNNEYIINFNKEDIIKQYGSFSAFEDVNNHIHIYDILNCKLMDTIKYGLLLKDLLKNKLINQFNDENIVIVLTCDGKLKLNTILRFYKYRENEKELYDQELINSFDNCKYKTGFIIEKI